MNDDQELVNAVLAGAPGAFARLIETYKGLCWHVVVRLVRDPEDARELCQDTFLRVHQYLHQYRFESSLKTWIARIAYTTALRHLERRRDTTDRWIAGEDGERLLHEVFADDDASTVASRAEIAAHVAELIHALTPAQRSVLSLYHLDELTIPEIVRVTGLSDGTVKSHLLRGRLRLRALVLERLGDPS
ncbi:RNA polymerase sigma factor [Dyella mobilis]|uniref:Sigma-70 family RNA polymerase sigma factor n=1 Tax=Dyella mobilis TaxID=1849582 RepID=A0ABS2KCT2_9GAMM|nr:sigma-70 family RNA polymerase sigma factor [Dyella mobilis]MBM7128909.1 sigma-70 family RNA polymerase sigma factor [Dyella mobilis]GLQ99401.1 RNA polymerase sigma24 factor [Dyella mobilis]